MLEVMERERSSNPKSGCISEEQETKDRTLRISILRGFKKRSRPKKVFIGVGELEFY